MKKVYMKVPNWVTDEGGYYVMGCLQFFCCLVMVCGMLLACWVASFFK